MTARSALRLVALLAILLTVVAQAQEGGRGRRGAPQPTDPAQEPDRTAIERGTLIAEFSQHLAEVRKRLNLRPDQLAAWDLFERRTEQLMQDQMRGVAPPPESDDALHQINRRVDVVRNRLAAMEDVADAAARLYGMLSADQRRAADEVLASAVPTLYSGLPDLGRGRRPSKADNSR